MKEYFSHDYNARNDKKLIKLFMKHGVSGIGIYWCIVEMLYEESGYLNIDEYERIAFELRIEYDVVKSVIQEFELFDFDSEKFWSNSAISRLDQRMLKSEKARESVMKRWIKNKSNTNVIRSNNDSNTIKVKESKVKESKEKEKKENFDISKMDFNGNINPKNHIENNIEISPEDKFNLMIDTSTYQYTDDEKNKYAHALFSEFMNSVTWVEDLMRSLEMDKSEATHWIEKYVRAQKVEGQLYREFPEMRRHCHRWIKANRRKI